MATSGQDTAGFHLLDNPIWHALSTSHVSLAEGSGLAKKYPRDVAPLCGITSQSPAAYEALREIIHPDDPVALFLDARPIIPPELTLVRTFELHQMVCRCNGLPDTVAPFALLTEADTPQMLALTKLTEPGPFRQRTVELGTYLGILSPERQLVAMAGERLKVPGFTEVSAVCTHPDHRGKGYARALMSILITDIMRRGDIPFLHVKADNHSAIGLYESLGFKFRTPFHLAVIKNAASRDQSGAA